MIDMVASRMPRGTLFLAFNTSVIFFLMLFVAAPMWSHFADRSEEISESAAQLSHFQALSRDAKGMMSSAPQGSDPFLPGSEERIVSADLQASLKTLATDAGVRLLGIRGLSSTPSQQPRMVAVNMELEGPAPSLRNLLIAIENQVPFLFVTAASLRSVTDGDDGLIRAELKVQGAMRDGGPPVDAERVMRQ